MNLKNVKIGIKNNIMKVDNLDENEAEAFAEKCLATGYIIEDKNSDVLSLPEKFKNDFIDHAAEQALKLKVCENIEEAKIFGQRLLDTKYIIKVIFPVQFIENSKKIFSKKIFIEPTTTEDNVTINEK